MGILRMTNKEPFDEQSQIEEARRVVEWCKSNSPMPYEEWRKDTYPHIEPYKYRMDLLKDEV